MKDYTFWYSVFDKIINLNIFGTRKIARLLSYLLIPKPKGKAQIKTLMGFAISVEPVEDSAGVEHDLYYKGIYEKGTLHIIKNCVRDNDTVIDIGANIGVMSLYASLWVGKNGKVLAFEANPYTEKLLKENIALNDVNNIKVYGLGLGSQKGTAELFPDVIAHNRGAASLLKKEGACINKITVPIEKLDDVVKNENIRLMKIDVEGWELEVLKGARNLLSSPNPPILIVECCLERENTIGAPSGIFNFLKAINSYKIFKLNNGQDRISKLSEIKTVADLPEHDNIVCIKGELIYSLPRSLFQ